MARKAAAQLLALIVLLLGPMLAWSDAGANATAASISQDPHGLSTGDIAQAIRFRTIMGLRADPTYVRGLQEAVERGTFKGTTELGVPLTGLEFDEISYRQTVIADDASVIRRHLSSLPTDPTAGLFMDNKNGGVLTLAVTHGALSLAKQLSPQVRHPERFKVVSAKWSLRDLERTKDAIFKNRASLTPDIDITTAAVDEQDNRVRIGVSGNVEEAQDYLDQRYGPELVRVVQESAIPLGTESINSPPFRGGQLVIEWVNPSTGTAAGCTSAFNAYATGVPVQYYLLTAGHCFRMEAQIWQAYVVAVGRVNAISTIDTDALRIPIPPAAKSNQVTLGCSSSVSCTYRSITSWQTLRANVVGETDCFTGINFSGLRCGALRTKTFAYSGTTWYGKRAAYSNGREFDVDCNPGDSGGPVLYGNQARGIMSLKVTRRPGNDTCVYTHIYHGMKGTRVTGLVTQ